MNDNVTLTLTIKEVDFLASLLQQVPYGQMLQAGQLNLLPKIAGQVQLASNEAPTPVI